MKNNNNEWSRQLHAGVPVCMEFDSDRWDERFLGIASEEQDESMADPSTENQDLPGSHTIIGECSTLP